MQINKCSMKKYDPEVIIDSLSLFSPGYWSIGTK